MESGLPQVQILTVEALLNGAEVKMPPTATTFKEARREKDAGAQQSAFDL
jgi:hypothetical protein